jgi:transcriptional regulator with XRE-family HTH domain
MEKVFKKNKNIPKPTNFGKNLKFLRRINSLSQGELAAATEMTRNNIASYESGIVEPNAKKFLDVCKFFSVSPESMLEDTMFDNPSQSALVDKKEMGVVDKYLSDQIETFVIQTNEMTKVYEGYKAFLEMQQTSEKYNLNRELYSTLEDLLDLLSSLIKSNWKLIQSIYPSRSDID